MRWAAAVRAGLVAAALIGALDSCSAPPDRAAAPSSLASSSPSLLSPSPTPSLVSAAVRQEIQHAVDSFNAYAGGPVSGQQAALAAVLDDGQRSVQRSCAAGTTTLRFEPVYGRLAPTPGWTPSQGTLSGTVYAVPTLIRIYTGDRITGTDLTDLHVAVQDGRARLPALCPG